MTAIRFILLKISIFICFSSFGQINDTWDAVKVGTTDIDRIYVGENIVWEKECIYGNLDDYTKYFMVHTFRKPSCGDVYITSLTTAKQGLDNYRNPRCGSGGSYSGNSGAINEISVNSYVLEYSEYPDDFVLCELFSIDCWRVINYTKPVGESIILHIESGIITYMEYY